MTNVLLRRIIDMFCLMVGLWQLPFGDTAAARDVWELRPLRVQAWIVADQSPAWTRQRLDGICRSVQRLAEAEIGAPWRLEIEVAPPPLQKKMLTIDWRTGQPDPGLLGSRNAEVDKTVIVVLRASQAGNWVEVWQYDHEATHWGGVCQQPWVRWDDVDRVTLDLMVHAVTPQAMIDRVDGSRVVLRPRGVLLPVRNPRREIDPVGTVFLLAARGVQAGLRSVVPETFLVVETREDASLISRLVSAYENPLGGRPIDQWIAVGCSRTHAKTVWTLTMKSGSGSEPLAGARIFAAPQPDEVGTPIGRTDRLGQIPIARTDGVVWLQLRWDSVLLGQSPVLPGNQPSATWATSLERRQLVAASQFVVCRADCAELLARRAVDKARIAARTKAGRKSDAKKLQGELDTWLKTEVPRVTKSIRDARETQYLDDSPIDRRLGSSWEQLEKALDPLK